MRLPTYHAGEESNFRRISCEDLEAASLTIMQSARVRRQEQDKSAPPQLQAATVLAQAGQLAFAPATVRSDTSKPVAVGPAGEQLHNRLQSRPQSASVHKRKGWHALQNGGPQQPSQTSRTSNTNSAVYVRPDRSVSNIPLGSSPSFPSLGGVADALPSYTTDTAVTEPEPNKQSSWSSPRPKHNDQQARNAHAAPGGGVKYSAALSPGKPQHRDSDLSKGLAMSDSELAAITSLLSIHPWAEPGLARAVLAAVNHNKAAADLLLREMEQHQAPSGSDSDEDSANHIIPPETSASEPAGEQKALSRFGQRQTPAPKTLKAPAPPVARASFRKCNKQSVDEGLADEDLYYKHRKEALKLSKAWRKKLHQAANAFAGSHYSGGEALANEAHQMRLKALAAHAEAAQKIEHDNNAGRGLSQFDLDLHGLHAIEAVEALDRRLLSLGQLQHHSQASKLRVIVGRGNNSSGGEASLPRVVESHLLQRNMSYIAGQGIITVYLRGLRH